MSAPLGHQTGLSFGGTGSSVGLLMQPVFDVASGDDNFFLDFDTLKTQYGFRYIWYLGNYLKPDKWGDMSVKVPQYKI
jgi:hypothetical protein